MAGTLVSLVWVALPVFTPQVGGYWSFTQRLMIVLQWLLAQLRNMVPKALALRGEFCLYTMSSAVIQHHW